MFVFNDDNIKFQSYVVLNVSSADYMHMLHSLIGHVGVSVITVY